MAVKSPDAARTRKLKTSQGTLQPTSALEVPLYTPTDHIGPSPLRPPRSSSHHHRWWGLTGSCEHGRHCGGEEAARLWFRVMLRETLRASQDQTGRRTQGLCRFRIICSDNIESGSNIRKTTERELCLNLGLPDGSSIVETTGDVSGWVWIGKHTGFVYGVFHDLGSCRRGQRGTSHTQRTSSPA